MAFCDDCGVRKYHAVVASCCYGRGCWLLLALVPAAAAAVVVVDVGVDVVAVVVVAAAPAVAAAAPAVAGAAAAPAAEVVIVAILWRMQSQVLRTFVSRRPPAAAGAPGQSEPRLQR